MLNVIMIGLSTIASLIGYNRFSYYDFTEEDLSVVASFMQEEIILDEKGHYTIEKIENSFDLYTIEGENRYICFDFDDSYLIYDKRDNSIDEHSNSANPYYGYQDLFCVYVEESNYIKYGFVDDYSIFNIETNRYLNETLIGDLSDGHPEAGGWYVFTDYGSNVKKIDNSFYFENLNHWHGDNDSGTCAIVAIQMLFGYYDTFENDFIIPDKFDDVTRQYKTDIPTFTQSPGSGDDFHDELIAFASERNITDDGIGMNIYQEKNLTIEYLNHREIEYTYKWVEGNWSDSTNNAGSKHVRQAIDAGRPLFLAGAGHATVAYAYDDTYVYVHSGWGDVRRTPWETYDNDFWDFWGGTHTVDITSFTGSHVHSDNYYSRTTGKYLCPCGEQFSEMSLAPNDYGFEPQYFFNPKSKNVTFGSVTFTTNRLRTGYIEEEKINLSPRRYMAGTAYLEYRFSNPVRKVSADLSFWSASENLSTYDSSLVFEYQKWSNNEWVIETDLLRDINLGTNRYSQEQYVFDLPNNTKAFRFYSTSSATGDRNKGRLSIGTMVIEYA